MNRTRAAGVAVLLALTGGGWAAPAQAVSPTATTLVLSKSTSPYGDTVNATAEVVTSGPADGDVYFTVDGTSFKTNVGYGGNASLKLPVDTSVGEHTVSARFVPRLPGQEPSASPATTWVVTPARTYLQVRVPGRGAHTPTSVVVLAVGDFGTRPSGAVTVTVRHLGTRKVTRRQRTLDQAGAATARLGVLRTGRYRLRVTYAGDTQHLAQRHSETFTVRQR